MGKPFGQQVTRKRLLSISQLKNSEGERGLAQSGGPNASNHICLPVDRGRESIGLRGLVQILADFPFLWVKEEPNVLASCQMSIMQSLPDCLGFWGFLFPWKAPCSVMKSKWYRVRNNTPQITSAMPMNAFSKNLQLLRSQISMTDDNQFIHALPCTPPSLYIWASFSSSPLPLRSEQAVLPPYFSSIPFSPSLNYYGLQGSRLTFFY